MAKRILYYLIASMICFPIFLCAQVTVSGIITDASNGEPLIGVNILVQGTSTGTITDFDGTYSLSVEPNAVIEITYTGYEDQQFTITGTGNVTQNVAMSESSIQLKDVVVTANRVEENLQKIPVAATVLTGVDLQNRSATNSLEALTTAPGLIYDAYSPSQVNMSIRGISTDNVANPGTEQGVGLYINDIFQSRPFGFNATLMDVERIEVLRGPQGTLFGKNTVGGVVHVITENPKMSNSGAVELSAGNLNYFQLRAKGNVVLAPDKLALRLTGALSRREAGFVDLNNENAENKMNFAGLKGSLLFKASEKVDAILDVNWSTDKSSEDTGIALGVRDVDGSLIPIEAPEDRVSDADTPVEFNRDQISASLRIKADIGNGNFLNVISGYGSADDFYLQDADYLPLFLANFSRVQEFSTFTQEVRINSDRDRRFAYVAGIFYANEKIGGEDTNILGADIVPAIAPLLGLPDGFSIPGYEESSSTTAETISNSFSLFGSGTYKLTDDLKLTAGIRYTNENKDLSYVQSHVPSQAGVDALGFPLITAFFPDFATENAPFEHNQKDNAITGDVKLEYAISDDMMSYVSFARGFKGAGFNYTQNAFPEASNLIFAPEFINNYEIGFKSKIGNRVRFNAAGFIMKYFDKQEVVVEAASTKVANAPESDGWGIEGELTAILAKGFQVEMSGSVLDFEYGDFPFSADQTGGPTNLRGNKLAKVPENTWSISPQYTTTIGEKTKLLARVDINHSGKAFNDILNNPDIAREPATLLNARLGLNFANGKYSVAVWGKNLTDEVYLAHGIENVLAVTGILNPRRAFGVDLRVAFY